MKCKYCHEKISKLDKDVCPFCGGLKPLEGVIDQTEDITKALESLSVEKKEKIKYKYRLVAFFLEFFLGIFGIESFYLGKWIKGLIEIGITLTVTGLGGLALYLVGLHNAFAFLIPFFVVILAHFIFSLNYLFRRDIKDKKGDYLK